LNGFKNRKSIALSTEQHSKQNMADFNNLPGNGSRKPGQPILCFYFAAGLEFVLLNGFKYRKSIALSTERHSKQNMADFNNLPRFCEISAIDAITEHDSFTHGISLHRSFCSVATRLYLFYAAKKMQVANHIFLLVSWRTMLFYPTFSSYSFQEIWQDIRPLPDSLSVASIWRSRCWKWGFSQPRRIQEANSTALQGSSISFAEADRLRDQVL
jgi:hypothetical protein